MSVLLFDIDGTLLHAHGVGKRHFEALVAELCGHPVDTRGISFAGRTDPAIARDVFACQGLEGQALDHMVAEFLTRYADHFTSDLRPGEVVMLPGVPELLDILDDLGHLSLGLLTGNMEVTARAKLQAVGLERRFGFGAYGSDHADRNQLPAFARDRAQRHLGREVAFEELVVIGDTPLDVACGKAVGARTVAVATGNVPFASLKAAEPDLIIMDFLELEPLLALLNAG